MTSTKNGLLSAMLLATAVAGCAQPPQAAPGQVLGYGTPGVESYLSPAEARTLADLQARCRSTAAPATPQTFGAACDQLHRTEFNQPGNTVGPARR